MFKQLTLAVLMFSAFTAPIYAAENAQTLDPLLEDTSKNCVIVYDLTHDKKIVEHNPERCKERLSPCSTFKIPNTLIGLETGVLKDENTAYKWDGSKQFMKEWERDHTLATAVQYSVVWYFKKVAESVGEANYKKYLNSFHYGNQDISSGLTNFWLGKSLKISPEEQLTFINNFYRDKLPVSAHARQVAKKVVVVEKDGATTLSGKTGTCLLDPDNKYAQMGWFVGYVAGPKGAYSIITNIEGNAMDWRKPAGKQALAISQKLLKKLEIW